MNGKVINQTPTNLSYGGVFTKAAASPITSLSSNVEGNAQLTISSHTGVVSMDSGSYKTGTKVIDVTKSGYTPLAIVSMNTGRYDFAFRKILLSGTEAQISVYCDKANVTTAQSSTVTLYVLYMKN